MSGSFATPWTVCNLPDSFVHGIYWSGLPFPSPGDFPDPGTEPVSPALQADSLPLSHLGITKVSLLQVQFGGHPNMWGMFICIGSILLLRSSKIFPFNFQLFCQPKLFRQRVQLSFWVPATLPCASWEIIKPSEENPRDCGSHSRFVSLPYFRSQTLSHFRLLWFLFSDIRR